MSSFEETPAHTAIFEKIKAGFCNLIISAVAGSGKTTTIVQALRLIPASFSVVFLAFNKKIAEELQRRVPPNVQAMTLNAMGHRAYASFMGRLPFKLETNKVRALCKQVLPTRFYYSCHSCVAKVVKIGKSHGIIPSGIAGVREGLVPDTVNEWVRLMDHFNVELPDDPDVTDELVISWARDVLRLSLAQKDQIDFDDQLYMTFAYNMPMPRFDWVFVDEAQDLSPLQHELVSRAMKHKNGLIAVGDENQAIYGFRGASSNSMEMLQKRFNSTKLPLHVSYRCPQGVVAVAQRYVSHIQAHKTAPMGVVEETPKDFRDYNFNPGEMVLCRMNAPLVKVAYYLIKKKVPCAILGKDMGKGLIAQVKRFRATDMTMLLEKLAEWENKEVGKFMAQDEEESAMAVRDKAETIRVFALTADTVEGVIANIEAMFTDDKGGANMVTLSTIHKSKGLEAEKVSIINFHDMPGKWAKKEWQHQQEINILYVGLTRSKSELRYITVPKNTDKVPI